MLLYAVQAVRMNLERFGDSPHGRDSAFADAAFLFSA
jgi:hypothetical protein